MIKRGLRKGISRGTILVALLLAAAACTTTNPASPPAETPGAGTSVAPLASATSSSTTTSTSTSTTTTTLGPQVLIVATQPVNAVASLAASDGTITTVDTPFVGELPSGAMTVTLEADGFNTVTEDLTLNASTELSLWLDPTGQLHHKIVSFGVGPRPKQVAFTPDESELWVTLLGGTGLEVYDPMTGRLITAVGLPEAGSVEVIFNAAGTLAYVSQMETASVYEIDTATHTVLRRLPTNSTWTKVMALSPDERTLYASNWVGNDVSEIDLDTGEVVRRIKTVVTPRGLYVTPDGGRLYVAGFDSGKLQVFDLATGEGDVIYSSGGSMRHLVGAPEDAVFYASDMTRDKVFVIDITTDEVRELATVDRKPNTIDVSPDGKVLYVSNRGANNPQTYLIPGPEWGSVVAVDTATGEPLDAIVGGNQTTGLDVSPSGRYLAFSDFLDDRVSVYEIPSYEVLAAGGGGRWADHFADLEK